MAGKEWTLAAVKQEAEKSKRALMVVDRQVLDLTDFLDDHPGGKSILMAFVGRDASASFHNLPHSPAAASFFPKFKVGQLASSEKLSEEDDLSYCHNLDDIETRALAVMPKVGIKYFQSGAEDDQTLRENVTAWRRYHLRPKVFVDVSAVDPSCVILGQRLALPILAAPTAVLKMAHVEAELDVARSCFKNGVGMVLSGQASCSMEEVATASPKTYRWFQLYVYKDRQRTKRLVQRAEKAGYSAICVTVDLPVLGNRVSLNRIAWKVPAEFKLGNIQTADELKTEQHNATGVSGLGAGDQAKHASAHFEQALTPELMNWLGSLSGLPLVLKGIIRDDDAERAASIPAVSGIVISNHGARQLDGCVPPVDAIASCAAGVRRANERRAKQGLPPCQLLVDGGIRRGRDVLKAIAMGASAVLIGRPMIWGLGAGGVKGVDKVLSILSQEITTGMQLLGVQNLQQLDASFVQRAASL